MRYLLLPLLSLFLVACTDPQPLAPDTSPDLSTAFSAAAGLNKEPISGTMELLGSGQAGRSFATPSGMCHAWDKEVDLQSYGDIVGTITFQERQHFGCDWSHFVGSGPYEGQITWNGRSGIISGQWTTNCKPDASQPLGVSCDGTVNSVGSDGLAGVRFHYKWGPGWYPFSYSGTAFYR